MVFLVTSAIITACVIFLIIGMCSPTRHGWLIPASIIVGVITAMIGFGVIAKDVTAWKTDYYTPTDIIQTNGVTFVFFNDQYWASREAWFYDAPKESIRLKQDMGYDSYGDKKSTSIKIVRIVKEVKQ